MCTSSEISAKERSAALNAKAPVSKLSFAQFRQRASYNHVSPVIADRTDDGIARSLEASPLENSSITLTNQLGSHEETPSLEPSGPPVSPTPPSRGVVAPLTLTESNTSPVSSGTAFKSQTIVVEVPIKQSKTYSNQFKSQNGIYIAF